MSTFVLVPGWWLGGWAWQAVAGPLRSAGHDVHAVTLTGLGERVHLAGPHTDLDTHVADVVNLLAYEDLHEAVLVAHSGAGVVATAVLDRMPDRVRQVVYVDSGPVPDGMALLDTWPAEARTSVEKAVADHGDGWRLPLPAWDDLGRTASLEGLDDAALDRFRALATPQPAGSFRQPLHLQDPARPPHPTRLVACSFPLEQVEAMIAAGHPWFAPFAGPHAEVVALPTGHWPMFSRPGDLADLLADGA